MRKIGDERKRLMAALHSFVLEAPSVAGFSAAVDKSDALKSNLEQEATLLQDFHIIFTCKVCEVVARHLIRVLQSCSSRSVQRSQTCCTLMVTASVVRSVMRAESLTSIQECTPCACSGRRERQGLGVLLNLVLSLRRR